MHTTGPDPAGSERQSRTDPNARHKEQPGVAETSDRRQGVVLVRQVQRYEQHRNGQGLPGTKVREVISACLLPRGTRRQQRPTYLDVRNAEHASNGVLQPGDRVVDAQAGGW